MDDEDRGRPEPEQQGQEDQGQQDRADADQVFVGVGEEVVEVAHREGREHVDGVFAVVERVGPGAFLEFEVPVVVAHPVSHPAEVADQAERGDRHSGQWA